jgi:hypothetical protein
MLSRVQTDGCRSEQVLSIQSPDRTTFVPIISSAELSNTRQGKSSKAMLPSFLKSENCLKLLAVTEKCQQELEHIHEIKVKRDSAHNGHLTCHLVTMPFIVLFFNTLGIPGG